MRESENTPFLTQLEEENLIKNWKEDYKPEEEKKLFVAFKPWVIGVVKKYQYYGILYEDLAQEGWLGFCVALCKYDPTRGARFSSYAKWWINAYCQDYVMRNWSIVRVGTTTIHKKLFFQLRYLKRNLEKIETQYFEPATANTIAKSLNISIQEIQNMYNKITQKDRYLDQKINPDHELTFVDMLADESDLIDSILIQQEEKDLYKETCNSFPEILNERELDIVSKRYIEDPHQTLEEISIYHSITKERVRQIEKHALRKLRKALKLSRLKVQITRT